ncbi:aldehyde dehydrogenase (NADP(+)) [Streptomyces sioyaensis]|uniref:aldehyde dehydrogenase (NADP(+)) n=1 Tax=Streptomyces sioyaensis TaxID=67364 RepID=UPI003D76611D
MPSRSIDPRTGAHFGPAFEDSTSDQIDSALSRAAVACDVWAAMSDRERAQALRSCADALDENTESLAKLADAETALGIGRLTGEVARASFQFRSFADLLDSGTHHRTVIDPEVAGSPPAGHPELLRTYEPVGVVAVFGAGNFPFAFGVAGGDTASALAAGCAVVIKAHPAHPQTSELTAQLLQAALGENGAAAGTLELVQGFDAGRQIILDPRVSAAAFTGSEAGGRALFDLAASRPIPIPFYGELGSVNPVVVLPSALASGPDKLAEEYVSSLTLGAGQFCTNPGLLLVPTEGGLAARIERVAAEQLPMTLLSNSTRDLLERHLDLVKQIAGPVRVTEGLPAGPGISHPVVVLTVHADAAATELDALTTECFGPVGMVVEYDDPAAALALVSRLPGCLVGTVHAADDDEIADDFVRELGRRAGRLVWNGWPTGVAVSHAQQHGGPYPASTSSFHTSVGAPAIERFLRPVAYQAFPASRLPSRLQPGRTGAEPFPGS